MLLLTLAVLPVIGLCFYIYKLDTRKEPIQLLIRLFLFGLLCFIPISACELFLDKFFSVDTATSFINIFVSVFFEIALVEEGFKWLVTKFVGYNSKYFDEKTFNKKLSKCVKLGSLLDKIPCKNPFPCERV